MRGKVKIGGSSLPPDVARANRMAGAKSFAFRPADISEPRVIIDRAKAQRDHRNLFRATAPYERPLSLGFFSNSLLLGPAGFDMAFSSLHPLRGKDAKQFAGILRILVSALEAVGVKIEAKKAVEDAELTWFGRRDYLPILCHDLAKVHPTVYQQAVNLVIEKLKEPLAVEIGSKAHKLTSKMLSHPKRPGIFSMYRDDIAAYASRLETAGREKEARLMWREAGLFNMKRGQEAMAMAEEDGKYHRRSGEQAMLEWAISAFWKAANAFQMVESDINHRWAVAAMQQAEGQLELAKNREDFEPPRRGGGSLTFSRPFEGEQEVDRELVRLATLACSGSAESFDFFLKKAAESLGTSPDDILEALAHPKEDLLAQLERKFFSFAKRFLNADLFAAIDPLEAGFYEKEPDPGIATLKGVGIFGALQIKLGNDNPSILNRLHALALKYKQ